jgi:hypothetical protein
MSTFKITRRELALEFKVSTSAKLESFSGTKFVPNHVSASVLDGEISSITFERLDADGFGEADPANPDTDLYVSYGGGELMAEYRDKLPKIALDALAEIEQVLV